MSLLCYDALASVARSSNAENEREKRNVERSVESEIAVIDTTSIELCRPPSWNKKKKPRPLPTPLSSFTFLHGRRGQLHAQVSDCDESMVMKREKRQGARVGKREERDWSDRPFFSFLASETKLSTSFQPSKILQHAWSCQDRAPPRRSRHPLLDVGR